MNIQFTLNVDGNIDDFASLLGWLDDHYQQVVIDVSVPEMIESAATETGPRLVSVNHPSTVVKTVTDYEYERAIERHKMRQHMLAEREQEYDQVISLDCRYCGAVAGKPCQVRATGRKLPRPQVHGPRRQSMWEWDAHENHSDQVDINELIAEAKQLNDEAKAAAHAASFYTKFCACGHDEIAHMATGQRFCIADKCGCSTFAAVAPFPPVTLDEM